MPGIPTDAEIAGLLDQLEHRIADDLETQWLEFKPWISAKDAQAVAVEYAVCFANGDGGALVFGVSDRLRGRAKAIHGARGYQIDLLRRAVHDGTRPPLTVEFSELAVPEGTLLVMRIPKGTALHGTSAGLFKTRVDRHCLPVDAAAFMKARIRSGAIDWSGEAADGISVRDLDPVEIARARNMLQSHSPDSGLLRADDEQFLQGVEAIRTNAVTNAGVLLFGRAEVLNELYPQNQIHYAYQPDSATSVARNDSLRVPLLSALQTIEAVFTGPANPEVELAVGFSSLRIPAFPLLAVREAIMNALVHRDYSDPGEILIRHTATDLVITSPGGFVGGITAENILRHEPIARNRTLANAFVKLRLVESAGVGRGRIFESLLRFGKRPPRYVSDGHRVTLTIFDGAYDKTMATLVARWQREGRDIDLDGLLVLTHLREHGFIDTNGACELLQLQRDRARRALMRLADPASGILEQRGDPKSVTFHLTRELANELLGKAAYTRSRGVEKLRYAELVRQFITDHGRITPAEVRELLGVGDSQSARVQVSRYLQDWSGPEGFLTVEGTRPQHWYVQRK